MEKNEECCDQECREIIEVKREARTQSPGKFLHVVFAILV